MQNRIKYWRKVRGLSQRQLADKVALSQTTISRLETGNIRLTLDMMLKCALVLEVPVSQLYSHETGAVSEASLLEPTHA